MVNWFFFFVIIVFAVQCSSIDFVPEPEYSSHYPYYTKTSWKEVEVLFSRPQRRFRIYGEVVVRDAYETGRLQDYMEELKKELFQKKLDGVYITNQKSVQIDTPTFQTMDSRGNITHTHESSKSMRVWKGYAFRYVD